MRQLARERREHTKPVKKKSNSNNRPKGQKAAGTKMAAEDKTKKLASTAAAFFGALAEFLNEETKPATVEAPAPAPAAKPAAAAPKKAAAPKPAEPAPAEPAAVTPAPAAVPATNGKDDPGAVMAKCRTALSEYSKTYGREGVRALLDKYGTPGKALSDIPVENLGALLAEASA